MREIRGGWDNIIFVLEKKEKGVRCENEGTVQVQAPDAGGAGAADAWASSLRSQQHWDPWTQTSREGFHYSYFLIVCSFL